MEVVPIESKAFRRSDVFLDHIPSDHLGMMYIFYIVMMALFVLCGWLAPSAPAHSEEAVDVSYPDCAAIFPVRLLLDNLTRSNSHITLSVAAVRGDLQDSSSLLIRYDGTVTFVSSKLCRHSLASNRSKIALSFTNTPWNPDLSSAHVISSEALPPNCESIEYNFSFFFGRPDIARLHFLFSYPDTAVYSYRRAIRWAVSAGFIVALLSIASTLRDAENSAQLFYCLMLGIVGLLGSTPLDFLFRNEAADQGFELLFDQTYITVYRIFAAIQVGSVAHRSTELPPTWLLTIAAVASLYGVGGRCTSPRAPSWRWTSNQTKSHSATCERFPFSSSTRLLCSQGSFTASA
jgi:hypothetical protein